MEDTILEIVDHIRNGNIPDQQWLAKLIRRKNKETHDALRHIAKRRLMPYYLSVRNEGGDRWKSWGIDADADAMMIELLRAKPRRSASGVATITVLTKPWRCGNDCIYCPNDIRMPKSYLSDEPACQRAERNFFDPYLQVSSRLHVLKDMGHVTDKIELIILGGTWTDHSAAYRLWFVKELFRALNDSGSDDALVEVSRIQQEYSEAGAESDERTLERRASNIQADIDSGTLAYNEALLFLYGEDGYVGVREPKVDSATRSGATDTKLDELKEELLFEHARNESGSCRVVGLVVETRPDRIDPSSLTELREIGCTKVQLGVQSLNEDILARNGRVFDADQLARAFALIRLFGFKSHVHMMANLIGATPDSDRKDYEDLIDDVRFKPDEVKLYPCALVKSAHLTDSYERGEWVPYSEEELIDLLSWDVLRTPSYMRISRMIRDISSTDIIAGNKKTNLRQLVEDHVRRSGEPVREIRMREVATDSIDRDELNLERVVYRTSTGEERFYQWVTQEGKIAGFLRLSLPDERSIDETGIAVGELPFPPSEAVIREVHVYGKVNGLGEHRSGAQHTGLGRSLIDEACKDASSVGYDALNVISAVGTREYYRSLGFNDNGLYQRKEL